MNKKCEDLYTGTDNRRFGIVYYQIKLLPWVLDKCESPKNLDNLYY